MEEKSILVLYFNKDNLKEIRPILIDNKFKVSSTNDIYEAVNICIKNIIDVVIIDYSSQNDNGLEQISIFRKYNSYIPILFLTNKTDIESKIIAFNSGANDYAIKPLNNYELIARVNNLLRFNKNIKEDIFENGDLKVNLNERLVYVNNKEVHLTNIEYKLLILFINNLDKVLTYDFIIENIWGKDGQDQNGLRVFVSNLRRKLRSKKSTATFIRTQTNTGYRMKKINYK